jgi:hypothetical protein
MNPYCICGKPVEGRTERCASCNRALRKFANIKLPEDPKPIKKQSDEMSRMMGIYARVAAKFLKKNPKCAVIPTLPATEIHHRAGRSITAYYDEWAEQRGICLLLDERLFLPVSRDGHIEIERRPEWAKRMGYSEDRLVPMKMRN